MKRDLLRLSVILLISAITGIITSHFFACLSLGLVLYIIWFHQRLYELRKHLREIDLRGDYEFQGILDDILHDFNRVRVHYQDRCRNLLAHLKRYQTATKALPDAVILLGENGRIEWANDKASDYLGINWPQDEGHRISNLLRDPRLADMLQDTQSIDADDRLELALSLNQDRYLEFRVVPYGDDQSLLVARDITEIHKSTQMRKDFIANASHELRTPLTVIAGYLEAIENDRSDAKTSRWSDIVGKMRAHAVRMQRLIEDLLKLSALESVRSTWDEVTVSELLSTVFNEAKILSGEMEHIFYMETNPNLWLKGNQQELYSAFSNLVFNAVQYTPEKGVIRIRWYEKDGNARMEVTDSGDGISSEHIPRLTERFYRVDKGRSRDRGGTGLGLAIVKHVLVNHNATLEIESKPGKGSTFRCIFLQKNVIWKPVSDKASVTG